MMSLFSNKLILVNISKAKEVESRDIEDGIFNIKGKWLYYPKLNVGHENTMIFFRVNYENRNKKIGFIRQLATSGLLDYVNKETDVAEIDLNLFMPYIQEVYYKAIDNGEKMYTIHFVVPKEDGDNFEFYIIFKDKTFASKYEKQMIKKILKYIKK